MASSWRRCDNCRRVLAVENFPSTHDEAEHDSSTCAECLAPPKATTPRRRATATVTTRRVAAPTPAAAPAEPIPLRSMIGRGEPAARRARARALALEQLSDEHSEQYREMLARATKERRGPGRARTELVEMYQEEFDEMLGAALEAEGLPRSAFG